VQNRRLDGVGWGCNTDKVTKRSESSKEVVDGWLRWLTSMCQYLLMHSDVRPALTV
jgi:hypothetical protein